VAEQIKHVEQQGKIVGAKKVLVLGASTGYGLASRITAAFGMGAATLGVSFEKEASEDRTGTAGWYNTLAFEKFAKARGLYAKSLNGDAFSDAMKQQVIDIIKQDLGQVDLVVYSLASPRRIHPKTGHIYNSTLKPVGQAFSSKTVDVMNGEVKSITIEPASEEDIANTVAVMGGEDWAMWMDALMQAGVLAPNVLTLAYNYIGPQITYPIYKKGTIGHAKDHLQATAEQLCKHLAPVHGKALISVNKALVTQASSAIPIVPLYISLLYKVMKARGIHEGCIEQMDRLFRDKVYGAKGLVIESNGMIHVDDWEMREDVQAEVAKLWPTVSTENLTELSDIAGYRNDFHRLFGFNFNGVDYDAEVDPRG
jgi:enoyl-[acyl-carrier protein] reductase/trans-2-enoyl-CoA reductase (NAD+)